MYDKRNGQSEKKILPQLINFLIKMTVNCILKNYENGKAILRVFEVDNSPADAFSRQIS